MDSRSFVVEILKSDKSFPRASRVNLTSLMNGMSGMLQYT